MDEQKSGNNTLRIVAILFGEIFVAYVVILMLIWGLRDKEVAWHFLLYTGYALAIATPFIIVWLMSHHASRQVAQIVKFTLSSAVDLVSELGETNVEQAKVYRGIVQTGARDEHGLMRMVGNMLGVRQPKALAEQTEVLEGDWWKKQGAGKVEVIE